MQSSALPAVGNFEQPVLAIENPQAFGEVHQAVETAFAKNNVAGFLKTLSGRGLRIRGFEDVLAAGLLGETARAKYASLGNADQGQIREFYLASLERVDPDLREKFYKLYAYY
jgi:hypothetical protein